MADFNMVNRAKSVSVPPDMIAAKFLGGKVRVAYDVYVASALASGSRLVGPTLPKGAILLPGSCVEGDDLSADTTIAVGDGTTANKFLTATVFTTANQVTKLDNIANDGEALAADTTFYLTTGGTNTATGTIKLFLFYATE